MARQRKLLSLEEQLEKFISDIQITEKHLQELRESKKDIEDKIRVRNMEELDALIVQSGKSYEDIKAMLMGSTTSVEKKKWYDFKWLLLLWWSLLLCKIIFSLKFMLIKLKK